MLDSWLEAGVSGFIPSPLVLKHVSVVIFCSSGTLFLTFSKFPITTSDAYVLPRKIRLEPPDWNEFPEMRFDFKPHLNVARNGFVKITFHVNFCCSQMLNLTNVAREKHDLETKQNITVKQNRIRLWNHETRQEKIKCLNTVTHFHWNSTNTFLTNTFPWLLQSTGWGAKNRLRDIAQQFPTTFYQLNVFKSTWNRSGNILFSSVFRCVQTVSESVFQWN